MNVYHFAAAAFAGLSAGLWAAWLVWRWRKRRVLGRARVAALVEITDELVRECSPEYERGRDCGPLPKDRT